MNAPTHEFVTVDMRGLKAALVARAQGERVSVSVVVRRAVERELGCIDVSRELACDSKFPGRTDSAVKLSLRLTSAEAEQLTAGARHAGGMGRGVGAAPRPNAQGAEPPTARRLDYGQQPAGMRIDLGSGNEARGVCTMR